MSFEEKEVFSLSGKREKIDAARAKELAEPLFKAAAENDLTRYKKIRLSGFSFGVDAAEVFADALRPLQGVVVVDFSDIIADRTREEVVPTLNALCGAVAHHQLVEFNLSDNALGAQGVDAASAALENQKGLKRLYFNNNGLQADAADLIRELVLKNNEEPTLEVFHIFNNLLQCKGVEALAPMFEQLPTLKDIRVGTTRVSFEGGNALISSLLSLTNLESINFFDNNFGDEAGAKLADVIRNNKGLKAVILGDSGTEGANSEVLDALLESNPDLEMLDLSCYDLSPSQAKKLAKLLSTKQNLRVLSLESNDIRNSGALAIAEALSALPNVESVNLSSNTISTSACAAVAASLKKCPKLTSLNLTGNFFKSEALQALRETFSEEVIGTLSDNEDEYSETEPEPSDEEGDDGAVDELADGIAAAQI